jgi:ABC-2 type transport system permease protein
MLDNVLLKGLRDRRVSLAWWAVGLLLFILMQIAFYPSMKDNQGIRDYMESAPEAVVAFTGTTDISSPVGYLNSQFFFLMFPILLTILAIGIGSDALAGEEGRGTLDLLLSAPLTRTRVLLEKYAMLVLAVALEALALYAVTALSALAVGMDLDFFKLAQATFSLLLLALGFGALALLLGAATGSKGLAIGITAALGLGAYVLNSLALVVEGLKPWRRLSPVYYYGGNDPLANGLKGSHVLVLLAFIAVLLAGSVLLFRRRDLST